MSLLASDFASLYSKFEVKRLSAQGMHKWIALIYFPTNPVIVVDDIRRDVPSLGFDVLD